MGRFAAVIALSLTLALLAVSPAAADEVILKDGSKLVGEVQRLDGGKLKIKTGFAGELEIDAAQVKSIGTADDVNVRLESGDTVIGKLAPAADGGQTVTGEVVGQRNVPAGQVKAVWRKDDVSPEVAAAQAKYEAARAKWKLRLELGINGQTGNSERVAINGRAEANRTTDKDRLSIYAAGRYARENGEDTTREILGGAKLEVDINQDLFVWGGVELENDEFENLDLRATATGGLGLFLIRKPEHEWKARGGLGLQHESFSTGGDRTSAIGQAGHDYWIELNEWLKFTHTLDFYFPLDDFSAWRATMENAGEIPLNKEANWKLRLGLRTQYDSQPDDGVDRLDNFYFLNMVWDVQ